MYPQQFQYQFPWNGVTPAPSWQPPQQQVMAQNRTNQVIGRVVGSLDEITVQEVPTDGSVALFPASDGSCVYGKRWMPDGSISTTRYVLDGTEKPEPKGDRLKSIEDRIGALYDMVEDISDNMPRQQRRTRRKAGDDGE